MPSAPSRNGPTLSAAVLRRYAEAFDRMGNDFRRIRDHSAKPKHFTRDSWAIVGKATRTFIKALEEGAFPGAQSFRHLLVLMGYMTPEWKAVDLSKFSDRSLLGLWDKWIIAALRSKRPEAFREKAGHFPNVVRDKDGRLLGKDGKPSKVIKWGSVKPDKNGKIRFGAKRVGGLMDELDTFDDLDAKNYAENRATDWADMCFVISDLFDDEAEQLARKNPARVSPTPQKDRPVRMSGNAAAKLYAELTDTKPNPPWIGRKRKALHIQHWTEHHVILLARCIRSRRRGAKLRPGGRFKCSTCTNRCPRLFGSLKECRDCFESRAFHPTAVQPSIVSAHSA